MAIGVGKRVVVPPFGIGTVDRTLGALVGNRPTPCFAVIIDIAGVKMERTEDAQFSLREIAPGFEVVVPMDASSKILREISPVPSARMVLERLQPADNTVYRSAKFPERLHMLDHALRSGSLDTCAEILSQTLAGLLAPSSGMTLSFGERKAVHAVERMVIGEIALALDEPADRLIEQVRARFTPNA